MEWRIGGKRGEGGELSKVGILEQGRKVEMMRRGERENEDGERVLRGDGKGEER